MCNPPSARAQQDCTIRDDKHRKQSYVHCGRQLPCHADWVLAHSNQVVAIR